MNYKSYTLEEAKRRMERYCAYQERCHQEVRNKLKEMRMIPAAIDQIIVHLLEHDFVNEQRFAEVFAWGKFNQKDWGRLRLRSELKKREISRYNIELALKQLQDADYRKRFHLLAEKKWQQLEPLPLLNRKHKLLQYLEYRGWEKALIYDKIAELARESPKHTYK